MVKRIVVPLDDTEHSELARDLRPMICRRMAPTLNLFDGIGPKDLSCDGTGATPSHHVRSGTLPE